MRRGWRRRCARIWLLPELHHLLATLVCGTPRHLPSFLFLCVCTAHAPSLPAPSYGRRVTMACATKRRAALAASRKHTRARGYNRRCSQPPWRSRRPSVRREAGQEACCVCEDLHLRGPPFVRTSDCEDLRACEEVTPARLASPTLHALRTRDSTAPWPQGSPPRAHKRHFATNLWEDVVLEILS